MTKQKTKHTFLVEIGTEELPPKELRSLGQAFAIHFTDVIDKANIIHGDVSWFATPRRIALKIDSLNQFQTESIVEKRGPAITKAFNVDGKPTKAAESWARSCGITIDQAEIISNNKGQWLVYRQLVQGKSVQTLLCLMVNNALSKLPFSKIMRWGDKDIQFIRPVHTVTLLLDGEIIPGKVLGISSGRLIRGHRFMGETEIFLDHAANYLQVLLERGRVMADYEMRKEYIRRDVEKIAYQLGGVANISISLLEEVTSLVEWPVVLSASFEPKFLALPKEAIIHILKIHHKYFPVYDTQGKLLQHFIFVANIESLDPKKIIDGNVKVVRPRLADAELFFNIDRQLRLEDQLNSLDSILFQKQLGTLLDKSYRIKALAGWIAIKIGADVNQAERAGLLSKCDLRTNMVFEFPEIQGVMGMYYARHDGETEAVAIAQKEQYHPRFTGDELPTTLVSCAVSIADKIDTLTGIFGIGQHPKGDTDLFALRRAAFGILFIIVKKKLDLDLQSLTEEAVRLYGKTLNNLSVIDNVIDFMFGRLRAWYQELSYSVDTIQAVLARRPTKPMDFDARVRAVNDFRTLESAKALAVAKANKRVSHILAQSHDRVNDTIQTSILTEPAEIKLAKSVILLQDQLQHILSVGSYYHALVELATLRGLIDDFFDSVMVMTKDKEVRINRLTILNQLRKLFLQIADISMLQLH